MPERQRRIRARFHCASQGAQARVASIASKRAAASALDHGFAQSRYQARAGRHEVVVTGGDGVRFSLDVSGSEPVDLRVD
jgi:hypothetical protein